MPQVFSSDKNGALVGSVMALQALVAQLVARHPDADEILKSMDGFGDGMRDSSDASEVAYVQDIATGIEGTVSTVREYIAAMKRAGKV